MTRFSKFGLSFLSLLLFVTSNASRAESEVGFQTSSPDHPVLATLDDTSSMNPSLQRPPRVSARHNWQGNSIYVAPWRKEGLLLISREIGVFLCDFSDTRACHKISSALPGVLVVLPGASGVAGSRLLSVRDVDDIAECSFSGSGKRLGLDCKTLSSTARSELTQSTLSKNQNTLVLDTSSGVLLCGNHSGELSCTTSIRYRNALAWSTRGGRQFSSSTAVLTANGQLLTCSLEFSSPSLSCEGISGMPAQMQQATYFWTKSGGFIAGLMQGKVFSCSYLAAEHRVATDSCAALVDISAPAKGTQFGVAQRGSGSADELPLIFSSAMNSDANSLQQKDGIGAINAALKAKFLRKPIRHSNPAQPMYSWLVEPIQVAAAQNQFFSDAVLNEPLTIALLSPDEDEPLRMEAFYDTHSSYQLSWEFQSFWEREIRDFWYQLNQRDRPPKEVCIANCRQNYDEFLQFCGFAAAVGTLAGATTGAGVGAVCVAGAYINYLHCQDTNCRTYPG